MNGKGKGPEKGRNLTKFRAGWEGIRWGRKGVERRAKLPLQQAKIPPQKGSQ